MYNTTTTGVTIAIPITVWLRGAPEQTGFAPKQFVGTRGQSRTLEQFVIHASPVFGTKSYRNHLKHATIKHATKYFIKTFKSNIWLTSRTMGILIGISVAKLLASKIKE